MSTTTQPAKPVRGSIKKVFNTVGSVADSVRLGADILNINLRIELATQKLTAVKEFALEFGITELEAQRLIEEA